MHAEAQVKLRGERHVPAWYDLFFNAMQERDRCRALPQIERAQKAIRARRCELRSVPLENSAEFQDLESAAVYLGILLQHIATESGNLLWD
jgi:hypothetical protein